MRKIIIAAILSICGVAHAQYIPYAVQIFQSDAAGAWLVGRYFNPPDHTHSYVLMYDGTGQQPAVAAIGSGLSWDGTTLSASGGGSQVNSDWNATSGVAQILNKPTIPAAASQSLATRSLNTAFQISTTRPTLAIYSVQISVTASISGGQAGDVIFEIASDSGFTTNVQTLSISGASQTYSLAVAIQGVQLQTTAVSGYVPTGYYARLRTVNTTGTPVFTYRAGQEVLM